MTRYDLALEEFRERVEQLDLKEKLHQKRLKDYSEAQFEQTKKLIDQAWQEHEDKC